MFWKVAKRIYSSFYNSILKFTILAGLWGHFRHSSDDIKKTRGLVRAFMKSFCERNYWLESRPIDFLTVIEKYFGAVGEEAIVLNNIDSYSTLGKMNHEKTKERFAKYFREHKHPKILLISHEFSLTGAPKAVLMLAKALKNIYGKSPVVSSAKDGPIREEFEKEGIEILDFFDIPLTKKYFSEFFNAFDLVIVTSWAESIFKVMKYIKIPMVWWSHEIFSTQREIESLEIFLPHVSEVWAGSPLVKNSLEKSSAANKTEIVLYGLDEIEIKNKPHDKIIFSVMASLEERKGQDVFLKAIGKLSEADLKKSKFYVIGSAHSTDFEHALKCIDTKGAEVEFVPSVSFDRLLDYYAESDVIVIPSRKDPMPIVATYAFMFSKLCICSDSIGTALLINDGENGILFQNGDETSLSDKLTKVIDNPVGFYEIARRGYGIYKDNFSSLSFESIVENKITNLMKEGSAALENRNNDS